MTRRSISFALCAVLALGLAGCSKAASPGDGGATLIATTAALTIVAPAPGAVFTPDSVPVELSLEGGTIVEQATTNVTPDTGHVHVSVNGEILTNLAGLEFDLVDYRSAPFDPGTYLLEVEFVAADHSPFSPREIEQLTFTIEAA